MKDVQKRALLSAVQAAIVMSGLLTMMPVEKILDAPLLLRKLIANDVRDSLPALLIQCQRSEGAAAIRRNVLPLHDVLRRGPLCDIPMAARILGYSGDKTCIPLLRILAKKRAEPSGKSSFHDFRVRGYARAAIMTLARLGDEEALNLLKEALSQDDAWTRYQVLLEMRYVARKELIRAIIPLLSDSRYPTGLDQPLVTDELYPWRIRDIAACVLALLVSEKIFPLPNHYRDLEFPIRYADAEGIRKWKEWWLLHMDDPEYR